jgi:WXG100 family type VII secretion target
MTSPGSVNYEEHGGNSAASNMLDTVTRMRTTIKKVTDAVDSSKGGWQGDASTACGQAAATWDDEAGQLNKALDLIQQAVSGGNKAYGHMDTENVRLTNLS